MKKKWIKTEVTKIRLSPEQAVLSCCDNTARIQIIGPASSAQCVGTCTGSTHPGNSAAS
ncbi:MAG: hypothetical protein PHC58_06435 [Candidatus Omnitrophica bacterium]|nr:hypothetical protein [Candidatus Omnitrophota bacterium]